MRILDNMACSIAGVCRSKIMKWLIALPITATLVGTYMLTNSINQTSTPQFSINVNAGTVYGTLNSQLFGSNIQWCSGGGVLKDPNHPEYGVRDDIVNFAKSEGVGSLVFPGGNTAETYRWRNGVGPLSGRTPINVGIGNPFPPSFGTDDFMSFAAKIGCRHELMIANYSTGTPQEAANWVEYCNATAPTTPNPAWTVTSYSGDQQAPKGYFAWLRKQFGHATPYKIEYWQIGNEVFWRSDLRPGINATSYANDVIKFSAAMKAVDPTIKIGAVSVNMRDFPNWDTTILSIAAPSIDFMAPHYGSFLDGLVFDVLYRGGVSAPRTVYFPATATYTFTATAWGMIATEGEPVNQPGTPPHMDLLIDGQPIGGWDVNPLQRYELSCPVTAGYHQMNYAYTNDYASPDGTQDRNLFIYGISMRSATMPEHNIWYPDDAEQQLLFNDPNNIGNMIDLLRSQIAQYSPMRKIDVLVSEGCLNYSEEGSVKWLKYPQEEVKHSLRHKGALWQAGFMNAMIREQIPFYCHWVLFDECHYGTIRNPADTGNGQPVVTPTHYVMQLYTRLGGTRLVATTVNSPTYVWPSGVPVPPILDGYKTDLSLPMPDHVPYMDVVSTKTTDGQYLCVMVTNRSSVSATTSVQISGFRPYYDAEVRTLAVWTLLPRPERIVGNRDPEMEAWNETEANDGPVVQPDDVSVRVTHFTSTSASFTYTFRPYSVTLITMHKR